MNFAASPVLALTLPTWRSRLLLYVFIACFAVLLGRAVYLQGMNNDFLQAKGESRYSRVIEIPANRGRILDRNGEALAISTPVKSIWAIPGEVHLSERQLARLAALLELSPREIEKRLAASRDRFWISTAGLGVPWVHVRLDRRPKYYQYDRYRAGL